MVVKTWGIMTLISIVIVMVIVVIILIGNFLLALSAMGEPVDPKEIKFQKTIYEMNCAELEHREYYCKVLSSEGRVNRGKACNEEVQEIKLYKDCFGGETYVI